MLSDASQNIYNAPWLLIWPSVALILTVMAFTLIGNGIRDALADYGGSNARKRKGQAGSSSRRRGDQPNRGPLPAGAPPIMSHPDSLLEIVESRVAYPRADGSESVVVDGVSLTPPQGRDPRPGR